MILLLEIHEAKKKKKNDGTSPLNQYIKKKSFLLIQIHLSNHRLISQYLFTEIMQTHYSGYLKFSK